MKFPQTAKNESTRPGWVTKTSALLCAFLAAMSMACATVQVQGPDGQVYQQKVDPITGLLMGANAAVGLAGQAAVAVATPIGKGLNRVNRELDAANHEIDKAEAAMDAAGYQNGRPDSNISPIESVSLGFGGPGAPNTARITSRTTSGFHN
jgi:hypothetical protein